jgi:hypothetical protein
LLNPALEGLLEVIDLVTYNGIVEKVDVAEERGI